MSKLLFTVFLIIFAFFLFANISNGYLWEDEGETAVLGQNTLKYGYPMAWDGKNLVTQEAGNDSNENRVWIHQSWLPFYISAFSQKLFGKTTYGARFLFVLFGFFSFFLFCEFTKKIFNKPGHLLLSIFLFTTYIPLILHLRQGRYYSLVLFSSLWLINTYLDFIKSDNLKRPNNKMIILNFSAASIVLFHSHYFIFVYFFAGIFVHHLIYFRHNYKNYSIITSLIPIFLITFPWIFYTRIWEKGGQYNLIKFLSNIVKTFFEINIIFPLIFLVLLIPIYIHKRKNIPETKKVLLWPVVFAIFFISITPLIPSFHYLLPLIPIFIIFSTIFLIELYKKNKIIALLLLIIFVFSNLLTITPLYVLGAGKFLPKPTSSFYLKKAFYLKDFIYEITHDYDGPIEGISNYLKSHAKPDDTLFVSYEAEPIIFYNNLKILRELPFKSPPNWIIIRNEKNRGGDFKWVLTKSIQILDQPNKKWNIEKGPVEEINYSYVMDYIKKNNYKSITINYPDLLWENGQSPLYHKFKTVTDAEKVIIYKHTKEES